MQVEEEEREELSVSQSALCHARHFARLVDVTYKIYPD